MSDAAGTYGTTNSDDPEVIRANIEATRQSLSSGVDALADKVTPSKIVDRQADKVKGRFNSVKERVRGSASDAKHRATGPPSDAPSGAKDALGNAASAVSDAPRAIVDK